MSESCFRKPLAPCGASAFTYKQAWPVMGPSLVQLVDQHGERL